MSHFCACNIGKAPGAHRRQFSEVRSCSEAGRCKTLPLTPAWKTISIQLRDAKNCASEQFVEWWGNMHGLQIVRGDATNCLRCSVYNYEIHMWHLQCHASWWVMTPSSGEANQCACALQSHALWLHWRVDRKEGERHVLADASDKIGGHLKTCKRSGKQSTQQSNNA